LSLLDPAIEVESLQVKWVIKLVVQHELPWHELALDHIRQLVPKEVSTEIKGFFWVMAPGWVPKNIRTSKPLTNTPEENTQHEIYSTWGTLLKTWRRFIPGKKLRPRDREEILRQPLFGNILIKDSEGKILSLATASSWWSWIAKGVWRIKDLWNEEEKKWHTPRTIHSRLKGCHKTTEKIKTIIENLPVSWTAILTKKTIWSKGDWASPITYNVQPDLVYEVVEALKEEIQGVLLKPYQIRFPKKTYSPIDPVDSPPHRADPETIVKIRVLGEGQYWVFDRFTPIEQLEFDPYEWVWNTSTKVGRTESNTTTMRITEYTTKFGYHLRLGKVCPQEILRKRWEGILKKSLPLIGSFNWEKISKIKPVRCRSNQWLLMYAALPVLTWLRKRTVKGRDSLESDLCKCCSANEAEDILHCLLNCNSARRIWEWVENTWKKLSDVDLPDAPEFRLLGIGNTTPNFAFWENLWDEIRIATIWHIWKLRCNLTLGNKELKGMDMKIEIVTLVEVGIRARWEKILKKAESGGQLPVKVVEDFTREWLGDGIIGSLLNNRICFSTWHELTGYAGPTVSPREESLKSPQGRKKKQRTKTRKITTQVQTSGEKKGSNKQRLNLIKDKRKTKKFTTQKIRPSCVSIPQKKEQPNPSVTEKRAIPDFPSALAPIRNNTSQLVEQVWNRTDTRTIFMRLQEMEISVENIQTLRPEGWLDDVVIDAYLRIIQTRNNNRSNEAHRIMILSALFYPHLVSTISGYNFNNVTRWLRNINVLEYAKLLLPILKRGNHWTLAIVDLRDLGIQVFDSIYHPADQTTYDILQHLCRLIGDIVRTKHRERQGEFAEERWRLRDTGPIIPQQTDGSSCGVFVCAYVDLLERNLSPPYNFRNADVDCMRQGMAAAIMEAGILIDVGY
jgi:hypothetical protein